MQCFLGAYNSRITPCKNVSLSLLGTYTPLLIHGGSHRTKGLEWITRFRPSCNLIVYSALYFPPSLYNSDVAVTMNKDEDNEVIDTNFVVML